MAAVQSRRVQDLLWYALFVVAIAAAYRFGLSFGKSIASPFWFPDSVFLCALLKTRPRNWWIIFLTALPIRLALQIPLGWPLVYTLESFSIDIVKAMAGALVMRHFLPNPFRFQSMRDYLVYVLLVVIAIPALAATVGAGIRSATFGSDYWRAWEQWMTGNALNQLIATPALLYLVFDPPWWRHKIDPRKAFEVGALIAGLVVSGYLAANTEAGSYYATVRFYSPVPFLIWAAIRFGMAGISGGVFLTALISMEAALAGRGPFRGLTAYGTATALQNYFLLRAILLSVLALAMEQRRVVENSLRESEERFRKLAQTAPVMIWMSDPHKLCEFVNQGWLDFTGRTLEQELGRGWIDTIHPDDTKATFEHYSATFDAREPFEAEFRCKRHDGNYRWILSRGVPRYDSGGVFSGYIGSALDVSDLKRVEELSRALVHSQRLAVMGELTATIAHEMRQPMSAILLDAKTAELLAERLALMDGIIANADRRILEPVTAISRGGAQTPAEPTAPLLNELRSVVGHIHDNVLRVDAVISRVRGFLRKQDAPQQMVDINDVVRDVTQLIRGDAVKRHIKLRIRLDSHAPLVCADRGQIEQVLLNLAVNGMDAMDHHGPGGARELTLDTEWSGNGMVEVRVKDCGQGIAPEHMPLLFESFFTTREQGMGLGLCIAKSIVVAHGGAIWVENNAGAGTIFHFTVPIAEPSPPA
jgi:PAS domain S-box-containing protein